MDALQRQRGALLGREVERSSPGIECSSPPTVVYVRWWRNARLLEHYEESGNDNDDDDDSNGIEHKDTGTDRDGKAITVAPTYHTNTNTDTATLCLDENNRDSGAPLSIGTTFARAEREKDQSVHSGGS